MLNRLLVVFTLLVAGCGQDITSSVSCSTDSDCRTPDKTGTLFQDGGDPAFLPVCCDKICALPAGGCESGYRYLTSEPSYGNCIADPMCLPLTVPDMSMPATD
jgi:hypothetical protein